MIKEKLSFIIPCYRSETTLKDVVDEIQDSTSRYSDKYEVEIILVNDGSPDNVWDVIKKLVHQNSNIVGLNFSRNFGQHSALMAGYKYSTGDIIIALDDDGQSPVDEFYKLIDKIHEGYDVVSGFYQTTKQTKFRQFGSWVATKTTEYLLDKPKGIKCNSFIALKRYVVEEMLHYQNAYPYIEGLILRVTKNIANVNVTHRNRREGQSGYSFKKLLKLWMNGFTAFSEKPLRIASLFGITCAFFGVGMGLFTILRKIIYPNIQAGFTSLMAIILVVGGIIMLLLGIIGEYVGRIYICINNAPQYVIKDVEMPGKTNRTVIET